MLKLIHNLCLPYDCFIVKILLKVFHDWSSINACLMCLCLCFCFIACCAIHSSFHIIACTYHGIILKHASHSCIIVIKTPENEPVEPTETAEPKPGVEFVVEPEENQGKQLSMIPFTNST
jgi:hypothetical protein